MHDKLVNDLGYEGNARRLLAPKTNNAFALTPPNHFTGLEMMGLEDVRSHYLSTVKKLNADERIVG